MNIRHVFCLLILATLGAFAQAQEKTDRKSMTFQPGAKTPDGVTPAPRFENVSLDASADNAPVVFAKIFFGLLQKNDIDAAYEELTRGSKIAERPEELKALKAKTREAIDVFGPILGYELADSKEVGPRLTRRTYISIGRDFPLRWRFYFYKPDLAWKLIDLRVDDRLGGMFDEPEEPKPAGGEQ